MEAENGRKYTNQVPLFSNTTTTKPAITKQQISLTHIQQIHLQVFSYLRNIIPRSLFSSSDLI
jgi:hypothetical protein